MKTAGGAWPWIAGGVAVTVVIGGAGVWIMQAPKTAPSASTACSASSKAGDLCSCKVLELRPTQFAVGMIAVKDREAELAAKSGATLSDYQRKNPEPAVKGPGGALFITDRHHLARAMAERGIETTFCRLEADYSELDSTSFWAKMAAQRWVYLYDENGQGPRSPAELPSTVKGLTDDPYRSLAAAVRDSGGFGKVATPFSEFEWANYFRSSGISRADIQGDFAKSVKDATAIARKRDACSLPGYNGLGPCQ
ncbi:MAG TPA: ParB-like protein [Casimicrobiaceae bacterium]|nr:ParB-like protein [Casimicrobiaceae bacterium]